MNLHLSLFSRAWRRFTALRELIGGGDLYDAQQHRSDEHEHRVNGAGFFPGGG